MAGVRRALIVATDEYNDPKLTSLNAPANDARALADVLRDESVGCFEVETVLNQPSHEVELAIADFFGTGKYGETLLAHFSCHGVKSPSGELYFATKNTDLSAAHKLKATGVPSAVVREAMEDSRASLILCLVDCCYSGAFVKLAKAADTVDLTERLGGKGRAVITASTSLQLALDGKEEPSLFTHAVIEGLQSGDADRDLDGLISLDELYTFVHDRVTSRNPNQTPVKIFDVQGDVYVARRSTPVTKAAPLDPGLKADARALMSYRRLGAVHGLAAVLGEGHPGRSFAAHTELTRMAAKDDSEAVRREARQVLDAAGEPLAPEIPVYEPYEPYEPPEPVGPTRGGSVTEDPSVSDHGTVLDKAETDTEADQKVDEQAKTEEKTKTEEETKTEEQTETEEQTRTEEEAKTDEQTEEKTGGGNGGGNGGRPWWERVGVKRAGVAALGLVGVLVLGGVVWQALGGEEGGDTGGDTSGGTTDTGPVLADTEILLHADDPDLGKGIFAFDTASAQTRMVIDDPLAKFPTISEDRQWITYLWNEGAGPVPRLARVDGSEDARLLDAETTERCPFTSRPAFSSDGGSLAAICRDSGEEDAESLGMVVVDRDGRLVHWVSGSDFTGAVSWTGDGRIVVIREAAGDGATTLWTVTPDSGEQEAITDGLDGSDSHPDWSDQGLIFLREQDGSADVYYQETLEARGVTQISSSGEVTSPTWAPGDEPAVVWLEPAAEGQGKTLMMQAEGDESPTELNTAAYGPPAWGSR